MSRTARRWAAAGPRPQPCADGDNDCMWDHGLRVRAASPGRSSPGRRTNPPASFQCAPVEIPGIPAPYAGDPEKADRWTYSGCKLYKKACGCPPGHLRGQPTFPSGGVACCPTSQCQFSLDEIPPAGHYEMGFQPHILEGIPQGAAYNIACRPGEPYEGKCLPGQFPMPPHGPCMSGHLQGCHYALSECPQGWWEETPNPFFPEVQACCPEEPSPLSTGPTLRSATAAPRGAATARPARRARNGFPPCTGNFDSMKSQCLAQGDSWSCTKHWGPWQCRCFSGDHLTDDYMLVDPWLGCTGGTAEPLRTGMGLAAAPHGRPTRPRLRVRRRARPRRGGRLRAIASGSARRR